MNNTSLDTKSFINIIVEKRKILLILIILTAIVSVTVSYLIPPKYKTIAVVYPVHISPYSEESQTEQLLQYFNSVIVRDIVIQKMKLIQHYKIDTTKSDYKSLLYYLYKQNISFSPTLYESIEIEVKDKQPQMTKAIAECIIQTTDSLILSLKKKIVVEEYSNYQRAINLIQSRIDSLNNQIVSIQNQYNILDAQNQSKYISKKMASGKLDAENQKMADILKNKRVYLNILHDEIEKNIKSLGKIIQKRDRLEVDLHGQLSFIQVISPPYIPDKKYFPVRWIIVALSELAVITLFITYYLFQYQKK